MMENRVKFAVLLVLFVFSVFVNVGLLVPSVFSWTPLEGHVTQDTTLTLAKSPYRVVNDVIVDSGVKLTVESGVEVQFADGFSLIVEGNLNASGTPSDQVVFTSSRAAKNPPDPYRGAWNTIRFTGNKTQHFVLEHVEIQYATNGITIEGQGEARVTNAVINNCSQGGLLCSGANNLVIEDSFIEGNGNAICMSGDECSGIVVQRCSMTHNEGYGVYASLRNLNNITLILNTISNNAKSGIYLHSYQDYASNRDSNSCLLNFCALSNRISHNGDAGVTILCSTDGPRSSSTLQDIMLSGNTIVSNEGGGLLVSCSALSHWANAIDATSHVCNITCLENDISFNEGNGVGIANSASAEPFYGNSYSTLNDIAISDNNVTGNSGSGITITSGASAQYGYYTGTANNDLYTVTVSHNLVSSNGRDGLVIQGSGIGNWGSNTLHDVNISSVQVELNGGHGISVCCSGSASVESRMYNITVLSTINTLNKGHGIAFSCTSEEASSAYNISVLNSTVFLNAGNGLGLLSSSRYSPPTLSSTSIIDNRIGSNVQSGISVSGGHGSQLFDLLILGNSISSHMHGIDMSESTTANITGNSLAFNTYGVYFSSTKGNVAMYNDIYGNEYGMNVSGGASVNAECNYWGSSNGPYHLYLNPEGEGNPVNGDGTDLDFIPFNETSFGSLNERPRATLLTDKKNVYVNETVTFDASDSTDNSKINYFYFDFGDGKNSGWTTVSVLKHNYTSVGVYMANLTVMDDFGVKSNNAATVTITVTQQLQTLVVTLTLNPTIVNSGTNVSVQVHVTNGTSNVQDASVQLVSDKGGTFNPQSGTTNSNGNFTTTFTAPNVSEQTNVRITATVYKTGYTDGSDYEYVLILPPGPVSLSVTVTANPSVVQSGDISTIVVQVKAGGNPIADATVVLSPNKGGTLSPTSGYTSSSGYLTSTYTTPTVTMQTAITITATASKSGYLNGQAQTQIAVQTATLSVTVTANPTTIQSSQTSTVTIKVTSGGNPVSDAITTLSFEPYYGGTLSITTGNTDSNGCITSTFTAPTVTTQTTITITANATKIGYISGQSQTQITVNSTQPDLRFLMYIAVVVILINIASAVAIARRKRRRTEQESSSPSNSHSGRVS